MSRALAKTNVLAKTTDTIHSVARNTSCNRGWLRLVMQIFFGMITATSFIFIIVMALQRGPSKGTICETSSCIVSCAYTPRDEHHIFAAILTAELECDSIQLTLREPIFINRTMPENWMGELPFYVESLTILGGNLNNIADNAFVSQFASYLRNLIFHDVVVSSWSPRTLVGLRNLKTLILRNTRVNNIEANALKVVANTLQNFVLTGGGSWYPDNFTGSIEKNYLETVNFALNNFTDILSASSFTGLEQCRDLFLNLCQITSIGPGTFDNMKGLRNLYLNDNYLTTIPPRLFYNIIHFQNDVTLEVNLQNNFWYCDCSQKSILQLASREMLMGDPLCRQPRSYQGQTFSSLSNDCKNSSKTDHQAQNSFKTNSYIDYESSDKCHFGAAVITDFPIQIVSPSPKFRCYINDIKNFSLVSRASIDDNIDISKNTWLHPTLVMQRSRFSMLQLGTNSLLTRASNYGLLWYQSECPNEFYCLNTLPDVLRLYNVNLNAKYTFCPVELAVGVIESPKCVNYDVSGAVIQNDYYLFERPLLYVATGLLSLAFGAMVVYAVIRVNPHLLKGSKRLVFVKHRSVDALVLPPKVPLRTSIVKEDPKPTVINRPVYTISNDGKLLFPSNFVRSHSIRSDKSSSPTYISALQPTEAQLAEWRIRNHFEKDASITSITSDISKFSWICDENPIENVNKSHVTSDRA